MDKTRRATYRNSLRKGIYIYRVIDLRTSLPIEVKEEDIAGDDL